VEESNGAAYKSLGQGGDGNRIVGKGDIEQKKLHMGDFACVLVDTDEEGQETEKVLVLVERKTISDLCGRFSVYVYVCVSVCALDDDGHGDT